MGHKFGFKVTTSMLAIAALTGCATKDASVVTKDDHLGPLFSTNNITVCSEHDADCGAIDLVVLRQPENVVYTTRADVTPSSPASDEAQLQEPPRAPARGALPPQLDADTSE